MAIVVRACGTDLDLGEVLKHIPEGLVDSTWRRGEPRRHGIEESSGFSLILSTGESERAVEEARTAFLLVGSVLKSLSLAGYTVELDIALFVPHDRSVSVTIASEFLTLILDAGVRLLVSAYPST